MSHSEMFEYYYWFYFYEFASKVQVWEAVQDGFLTKDEYKQITGEEFGIKPL